MGMLIEAIDIWKRYGKNSVLRGINLCVGSGEFVGITGENGSGKSTLLNILSGLQRPSRGNVRLSGKIGYCSQEVRLFPSLTVAENFRYFASAYGLKIAQWQPSMELLMQRFRFSQTLRAPVSTLSGGTKQKLNLCIALLHSPDIVILDEPYASFDWDTYCRFWEYARELKAAGKCIALVSHLIHDTQALDAHYEIREGVLQCISKK